MRCSSTATGATTHVGCTGGVPGGLGRLLGLMYSGKLCRHQQYVRSMYWKVALKLRRYSISVCTRYARYLRGAGCLARFWNWSGFKARMFPIAVSQLLGPRCSCEIGSATKEPLPFCRSNYVYGIYVCLAV